MQYMVKVLGPSKCVKSGLQSFAKKKKSSLDHAPQSSRPVEVDCNQIETWIENNQHSTTQEMADIVQISSVKHHLHQFDVWASRKLSEKSLPNYIST